MQVRENKSTVATMGLSAKPAVNLPAIKLAVNLPTTSHLAKQTKATIKPDEPAVTIAKKMMPVDIWLNLV